MELSKESRCSANEFQVREGHQLFVLNYHVSIPGPYQKCEMLFSRSLFQ